MYCQIQFIIFGKWLLYWNCRTRDKIELNQSMLHLRLSQVDFFLLPDFFLEPTDYRFFEIALQVPNSNKLNGIVSRQDPDEKCLQPHSLLRLQKSTRKKWKTCYYWCETVKTTKFNHLSPKNEIHSLKS